MTNDSIPKELTENYFDSLVGSFFKILPIRESNEPSLSEYLNSFQAEMIGFRELMENTNYDASILSLLSILQYLIDNDCSVSTTKREVFKAISICKKMKNKYAGDGG